MIFCLLFIVAAVVVAAVVGVVRQAGEGKKRERKSIIMLSSTRLFCRFIDVFCFLFIVAAVAVVRGRQAGKAGRFLLLLLLLLCFSYSNSGCNGKTDLFPSLLPLPLSPLLFSSFPYLSLCILCVVAVAVAISFTIFSTTRHFSLLILFPYLLVQVFLRLVRFSVGYK